MRTFSKILTLSALLFALCQASTPAMMISLAEKEKCDAFGRGVTSKLPLCKVKAIDGKCAVGFHLADKDCLPNTDYCAKEKYDNATNNCKECKWYAFHVQNDAQSKGTKTGNYCETRWWWVTLWASLSLIALLGVFALIKFLCCKPKAPKEGKRLLDPSKARGSTQDSRVHRSNEMVEVHRARPVQVETREVRHESPARYETREVRHESPARYETREVRHESPARYETREVHREAPVHYETRDVHRDSPRGHTQARTSYSPYKNSQNLVSHAY
jgi:hypothetical protein